MLKSKILVLATLSSVVVALASGEVARNAGISHRNLGPGNATYSAVGRLIQIDAVPFSPHDGFWENWSQCSADSTIWLGGPNIYSSIGSLLAVTQPGEISFQLVDSRDEMVEWLNLPIAGSGLYHLEMRETGEGLGRDCSMFLVAKGDTLGRFLGFSGPEVREHSSHSSRQNRKDRS